MHREELIGLRPVGGDGYVAYVRPSQIAVIRLDSQGNTVVELENGRCFVVDAPMENLVERCKAEIIAAESRREM